MAYGPVTDLSIAGQEPVCTATGRAAGAALPYGAVSGGFALVLLVAAALKARWLWLRTASGSPADMASLLEAVGIAVELLLAAWLVSGLSGRWARRAAISLTAVFVLVASWHWLKGDVSCGCFGQFRIHPAWMLGLDTIMLGAFLCSSAKTHEGCASAAPWGRLALESVP